jgi:hypothetical protein
MSLTVKIQTAPFTDHIASDGTPLSKLPYPFYVDPDGGVQRQDVWQGKPKRVVGFQKDLAVQQIDLWWRKALEDPQQAVGMYLVTENADGQFWTHNTAVDSVEVLHHGIQDGQHRSTSA